MVERRWCLGMELNALERSKWVIVCVGEVVR